MKSGKGPPLGRVTQRNQERRNDLVRAPFLPHTYATNASKKSVCAGHTLANFLVRVHV